MRLFICHVWEDKEDFVEPLANALRNEGFEVWYDKFQLTLGDSLLKKISEGLASTDFGGVVLSKAFFGRKKWAENELAGLFALETSTRKIILPIWKDVTEADVRAYSPILADRVAVSASAVIDKVVEEIKVAVSVSKRKDEIARHAASSRVKALVGKLEERREAEKLAYSEQGAQLVSADVAFLFDEIERTIKQGAESSSAIKFGFGRPMPHILYVNTVYGMYLGVSLRDAAVNSVVNANLEARIFKKQFDRFGEPLSDSRLFELLNFKPSFRDGDVIWIADDEVKSVFGASDLAGYLVDRLVDWISKQTE